MHQRTILGSADVDDDALSTLVAASLDVPAVRLVRSHAEVAPYDLEAITTAGRYRVRGRARLPGGGEREFSIFVKVVQSFACSPLHQLVPPAARGAAVAMLPHLAEPRVYRSDLADRLPPGLAMPRALAVVDLDDEHTALWLEDVPAVARRWDRDRFVRAAYLLGRLAGSADVRPLATVADPERHRTVGAYAAGRVAHGVLPALRDPRVWEHPLVAEAVDPTLCSDLLAAAAALPEIVAELEAMPHLTAHGDACPRNLLVDPRRSELVLIDFGFWTLAPVGFDLGQLLLGEVALGERPAHELAELGPACLTAYVGGLRAEGCEVPEPVVRRAHALQMLLFNALSALPLEHLDGPPTPTRRAVARERAGGARFVLDLVAATGHSPCGTEATRSRNPAASSSRPGSEPVEPRSSGYSVTPDRT